MYLNSENVNIFKHEAKWAAIVTAIIAVPLILVSAYISNVHAGPGIESLFRVGFFVLLPVFFFNIFSSVFATVFALVVLEPLWLFGFVLGLRVLWVTIKKRYITKPSSGRGKRRRAA